MDFVVMNRQEIPQMVLTSDGYNNATVISAKYKEFIEGTPTLELEVKVTFETALYVKEENIIGFRGDMITDWGWQFFVIKDITVHDDLHNRTMSVYCESYVLELLDNICNVELKDDIWSVVSKIERVLEGTRWAVDPTHPPDDPTHIKYPKETKNKSVLEVLQTMASEYGLHCKFVIQYLDGVIAHRYVTMKAEVGQDRGVVFDYNHNIASIERTVDSSEVKTAIIPLGGVPSGSPENTPPINISSVTWTTPTNPANKPAGQDYLVDPTATDLWGFSNPQSTKFPRFVFYQNDKITSPADLIQDAWNVLQVINAPIINYKMTVLDLFAISGYDYENYGDYLIGLGDIVTVVDRSFLLDYVVTTHVISREVDLLNVGATVIELGNAIKSIVSATSNLTGMVSSSGNVLKMSSGLAQLVNNVAVLSADVVTANTAIIGTARIEDASITNAKIANLAVDSAKIADATITNAKIQDATITSAKIGDAQITNAKIVNLAVDSAKIADASITNAKIDRASADKLVVTSADIADATIGTAKIATGAITTALINTGAVNTAQIADGSITDAKIVGLSANKITAGTIDAGVITVNNLNANNITTGTINGTIIADGAIVEAKLGTDAVTTDKIASGAVTNDNIFAGTITGDRLVADAITAREIASQTITANEIASNTITASQIASGTITANEIASGTITATQLTAGQIVAKDFRTALNVGNGTVSGVMFNSDGIQAWNGANQTVNINTSGQATIRDIIINNSLNLGTTNSGSINPKISFNIPDSYNTYSTKIYVVPNNPAGYTNHEEMSITLKSSSDDNYRGYIFVSGVNESGNYARANMMIYGSFGVGNSCGSGLTASEFYVDNTGNVHPQKITYGSYYHSYHSSVASGGSTGNLAHGRGYVPRVVISCSSLGNVNNLYNVDATNINAGQWNTGGNAVGYDIYCF